VARAAWLGDGGGALAREIAALIEAGGQPKPRRGQGRSHRDRARDVAGAGPLWEGSSDPDSDGGQCAALGSGLGGSQGRSHRKCTRHAVEAGSLWEGSSDPDSDGGPCAALGSGLCGSQGRSHRKCARHAAGAGFCGRGLLTPTATVGCMQLSAQAPSAAMAASCRTPSFGSWREACGSELARDCGLDRTRRPAKAVSRPRPLPQGAGWIRFCGERSSDRDFRTCAGRVESSLARSTQQDGFHFPHMLGRPFERR